MREEVILFPHKWKDGIRKYAIYASQTICLDFRNSLLFIGEDAMKLNMRYKMIKITLYNYYILRQYTNKKELCNYRKMCNFAPHK